jgi:hypothetical protein
MKQSVLKGALVAGAVVVAALGLRHYSGSPAPLPDAAGGNGIADAVTTQGPLSADSYVHVGSPAAPAQSAEEAGYNPAEAKIKVEDKLVELDDRLRAEPVSPEWAARSSNDIRQALAPENLQEFNAKAPQALEVSCRSTGCRISMEFDDAITAPDTVTALTVGIASRFPEVVVVPVPGEHGVQYHVFAASTRKSHLLARTNRG